MVNADPYNWFAANLDNFYFSPMVFGNTSVYVSNMCPEVNYNVKREPAATMRILSKYFESIHDQSLSMQLKDCNIYKANISQYSNCWLNTIMITNQIIVDILP